MSDVTGSMVLEGNKLPIAWIRLNPDTYREEGRIIRVAVRDRHQAVIDLLGELERATSAPPVSIRYLYYNLVHAPVCTRTGWSQTA